MNTQYKKFSDGDIKKIRELYSTGEFTQKELSLKFNMSLIHLTRIINFKRRFYV